MRKTSKARGDGNEIERVRLLESRVASLRDRVKEQERRYHADVKRRMKNMMSYIKITLAAGAAAALQAIVQ